MKTTVKNEAGPTSKQIKLIHILANKLEMTEERYRSGLLEIFGVSSSKLLTYSQAEGVVQAFQLEAVKRGVWSIFTEQKKFQNLGNRKGMATPAQITFINDLWFDVSWSTDTEGRERGLRLFLAKTVKMSDKRFLTKAHATKVIEILKQMKRADSGKE